MNVKPFLWTAPFLCFLTTYLLLSIFVGGKTIQTPSLIGSSINDALNVLSQLNLHAQLLHQKIDDELPEGTVLSQSPSSSSAIKQHQTVYLTTSKKPDLMKCPSFIGLYKASIIQEAKKNGITITAHELPHKTPEGICIAHYPQPGRLLTTKKIICYCSAGPQNIFIMPSFKGHSVDEVIASIEAIKLEWHIVNKNSKENEYAQQTVSNQKPLPGTIINTNKPTTIQLVVR